MWELFGVPILRKRSKGPKVVLERDTFCDLINTASRRTLNGTLQKEGLASTVVLYVLEVG